MKVSFIPYFILTLISPIMLCAQEIAQPKDNILDKVVIDAGHGGKDPGTVYGKIYEKNINLSVALKLGKMIQTTYPEVEVIYTRKNDTFIALSERGNIANRAGADLFISIHVDAARNTTASGATTYIMGLDKGEDNLEVAMRENDVIMYEEDYSAKYEGYVPGSAESYIIFSLMQYAHQEQSMIFSEMVQKHYILSSPMLDRGARQAPYLVLWNTAMPSVLTELGFMTNKKDREFLATEAGQQTMAKALFDAFAEYKQRSDGARRNEEVNVGQVTLRPQSQPQQEVKEEEKKPEPKMDEVKFYVQIMSVSNKLPDNSRSFKSYRNQVTQKRNPKGTYRCLVGGADNFKDAQTLLGKVKKEFKDAFIVAYRGDEHIDTAEARRLTER